MFAVDMALELRVMGGSQVRPSSHYIDLLTNTDHLRS